MIHSPLDKHFAIDATALDVVVLDRSAYDKQIADEARTNGAEIVAGERASGFLQVQDGVSVDVGPKTLTARYFVDATGLPRASETESFPQSSTSWRENGSESASSRSFSMPSGSRGFFAWVIPFGPHVAKVGAAGLGLVHSRRSTPSLPTSLTGYSARCLLPSISGGLFRSS